jgi:tetratricopeptide (TPR) repeat protein
VKRAAIALALTLVGWAAAPAFAQTAPAQGPRPAPAPAAPPADRILVVPFENVTRDGRIFWLSEASSVLLTDDLNALGAHALTREERREAFERLQVPPVAAITDATVIRIGQIVGAAHVVIGTVELDGDELVVHARDIALEAGRVQNNVTERGRVSDLFAIFERIARTLAPASSRAQAPAALDHPVLAAFESYIKGILADKPETAVTYLNASLQAQPSFDRARLALWEVYDREGEHEKALASVVPIVANSPWARRGQFLAGLSEINLKRYDAANSTFKALVDRQASAQALNNLGVVQMRRGAAAQAGQATYFFDKAETADPTDPDYCFNLGYAYWEDHDAQAATYWLREAVRRDVADGDAHFVLGAALSAAGNASEANRERELARRLSSTYAEWEKRPGPDVVPKGLERIKTDEFPRTARIEETLAVSGQRNQQDLARFYLSRGRREYQQENDRDALADLNRALYLSPYDAQAHLLVGRIQLRGGRVREAIDAFKISLWSTETADAHAALAEAYLAAKDMDGARSEAERALAMNPALAAARQVLDKLPK